MTHMISHRNCGHFNIETESKTLEVIELLLHRGTLYDWFIETKLNDNLHQMPFTAKLSQYMNERRKVMGRVSLVPTFQTICPHTGIW